MAANTVTIDRDIVERFIGEVDGIATFDSILHGRNETWLQTHLYKILDEFEKATIGTLSEDESEKLHTRAIQRGGDLFREFAREMVGADAS